MGAEEAAQSADAAEAVGQESVEGAGPVLTEAEQRAADVRAQVEANKEKMRKRQEEEERREAKKVAAAEEAARTAAVRSQPSNKGYGKDRGKGNDNSGKGKDDKGKGKGYDSKGSQKGGKGKDQGKAPETSSKAATKADVVPDFSAESMPALG